MAEHRRQLGVVMDPIATIKPYKDSTFAMLLEAGRRGWQIWYMEQSDLSLVDGVPQASMRALEVRDDTRDFFSLGATRTAELAALDVILMRKDPPFDMEYVYTTYILQRAEDAGVRVVNKPAALRDIGEKAYVAWFAELAPPTIITRSQAVMKSFLAEHGKIVVKPMDGMGGKSIFVVTEGDPNGNVILETITDNGRRFATAQTFVPQIRETGDKRILLVGGEAVPYALARIPQSGDHRGNLAVGGRAEGHELTPRDREICTIVGPELARQGVVFAGIDVIGDYLTEVNVTSPTGIRELDKIYSLNIAGLLFDQIDSQSRDAGR